MGKNMKNMIDIGYTEKNIGELEKGFLHLQKITKGVKKVLNKIKLMWGYIHKVIEEKQVILKKCLFVGLVSAGFYYLIKPFDYEIRTLFLISFVEVFTLVFSVLTLNLLKSMELVYEKKQKRTGIFEASVFLAIHLCVSLSILAIYITQITG